MNVKQIKQLEPLADVYELNSEARYIIRLPAKTTREAAQKCCEIVNEMGCKALVFRTENHLNIMEYDNSKIKDEQENGHEHKTKSS